MEAFMQKRTMSRWIGYMTSIKCADKGTYQGEIIAATDYTITLGKTFCNGIPHSPSEVTISAEEINDLKFIHKIPHLPGESTITVVKPVPKRAGRTSSTSENASTHKSCNTPHNQSKSKPIDIDVKHVLNESALYKNGTPNKKDKSKRNKGWKDEACFGSPLDNSISKDFDFEKNLALFDKQAVWNEISNSQKPDIVKQADQIRKTRPTKYRHDENVIATEPAVYRQIIVPKQEYSEYITDDGLVIPCISRTLRNKLWAAAVRRGISWERQVELIGRAATEMALQLLGGGHRLNPRNTHQRPTVVVLCGCHRQGAMGINAARQIASHGVSTVVYIASGNLFILQDELKLYTLTKNKVVMSIKELPSHAVDLVILARCEDIDNSIHSEVVDWTNSNRAPVLALDPVVSCSSISVKFSLVPVLPLSYLPNIGKIYLCNLGIPLEIFSEVGIKYQSPFGPKFVIPLHVNKN